MKSVLTIILALSFFAVNAQEKKESKEERQQRYINEGNPFKEYGYKPRIATLSKGKYKEFFTDSIVQIGSFTFNRVTGQITGMFILENLGNSEADLKPDLVSRWFSPDPLSDEFPSWSPYNFVENNPIRFIDPDGRMAVDVLPPSTHLDEQGNVIAEYDDGDDGVYVHSTGTTQSQIDQQRIDNKNTGGTGTHIGELGGTLDANTIYSNTLSANMEEAKGIYNPFTFRNNVKNGGKWDLKNDKNTIYGLANDGKTQFSFEGSIMESQDIGNHHYGAVGKAYGFFSETFMLKQAGEAQIVAGTSKPEWQIYKEVERSNFTRTGRHYFTTEKVMQPPYGDDPRDQRWVRSGFQYFKNNK